MRCRAEYSSVALFFQLNPPLYAGILISGRAFMVSGGAYTVSIQELLFVPLDVEPGYVEPGYVPDITAA